MKMKTRSMFSKILTINIVSMIVTIIILGSTQMILMTNYVAKYNEDYLKSHAETIANMLNGTIPIDALNSTVHGFARATGSCIFVFDKKGNVISNSGRSDFIDVVPKYISEEYTKVVLSGQRYSAIGTMGNLFKETMFTLQIPVIGESGEVLGAVSLSRPIPEHQKMKNDLLRILFISILIIAALSIMMSYLLAKNVSVPIKDIRDTTKKFAKGDFSERVGKHAENSRISEISELAEAFNNMATELEKAEEIKNSFISDVSHELRTPMTTISGFIAGILDDTIPPEQQSEYLKIVYDETNRLSRLVNTFLDITRLQSDKMVLKRSNFDINELIRIAVIGVEGRLEEKKIDALLDFESEKCYVNADKDSIIRVVTNLIDNAVKFTDIGGKITVTTYKKQRSVYIKVRNTGCGISKEQLPFIFERFYKTDRSRSINKEGTGIGLYLAKNIITAHGRQIKAESVEGEYAEFVFSLDDGKMIVPRIKKIDNNI